ncbi:MAG: OmpA family protein [Deltaproteobacteria bacterium]|nr:OmpA family protein [Deltaproteobacteria bacterium]
MKTLTFVGIATFAAAACSSTPKPAPQTVAAAPVVVREAPKPQASAAEIAQIQVTLRRVHFALNSAKLLPSAQTALKEAAEKLKTYSDLNITVVGHTDERGSEEYNQDLARRRAEAVVAQLAALGIDSQRLQVESRGKGEPLQTGSSARVWAVNRRVEFRFASDKARLDVQDGVLVDDQGKPLGVVAGTPKAPSGVANAPVE